MNTNPIPLTEQYPFLKEIGIIDFRCDTINEYRSNFSKHHHNQCYEIGYLKSGVQKQLFFPQEPTSSTDVNEVELHGGDLILFSPYTMHATAPIFMINACTYWLVLDPDSPQFLNYPPETSILLKDALQNIKLNFLHLPESIASRLQDAFTLLSSPDKIRVLRACNLLSLFIIETAEFAKEHTIPSSEFSSLSPAAIEMTIYINNNLLNPELTLNSIAEHLHYSCGYTSTLIKNELGMTLRDFIAYSKILRACKLLHHYSITEVAMMLNFSSSQYFSNVFKKYMHMTPSEYRVRYIVS